MENMGLCLDDRPDEGVFRVHRRVFTDPDIFQLEQKFIFERTWIFLTIESQIPNPGDFFLSFMGEDRVICVRDNDGGFQVLVNSCRHRGMKVCRYDQGNTLVHTCPFHAWTYSLDGRLIGVPRQETLKY